MQLQMMYSFLYLQKTCRAFFRVLFSRKINEQRKEKKVKMIHKRKSQTPCSEGGRERGTSFTIDR
ncbi:Uncharacterized protein APZ42_012741 [Daphnia magna]|uniref:Uncharacterized protein n=1 Tax=Daphnia magna TaxID=35525 RepID=A0A0P6IJ38_9CRUS|nr:Uncharacterized protein APZ42_012741 [Daphnia magna]